MLLKFFIQHLGLPPKAMKDKIKLLSTEQAYKFVEHLWDFTTLADAQRWLDALPRTGATSRRKSSVARVPASAIA